MAALNWKGLRKEANQPIVKDLKFYIPRIFPEIPMWRREGLVGGYSAASFGGGHEYGLAADIYVRVTADTEKRIGDGLFELFCLYAHECGVQKVIWNKQAWEAGKDAGPRPFLKDPHTDHVHVTFTRAVSQQIPARLIFRLHRLHDELFPR